METNYNLPQPYVRYRNKRYPDNLCAGDVVAYRKLNYRGEYSTGIMIISERNMFLVATNWSCGELWYNDMIDDRIELFEANEDEISWASRFIFNYLYGSDEEQNGVESILKFVNNAFPKENFLNWHDKQRCMNIMAELPWCVTNVDWDEAKAVLWKWPIRRFRIRVCSLMKCV